jgi:brefeldin A-resistance guanine nucleotide exchange factor 1
VLSVLVEGLLDQIPEDDQAVVISVKQDSMPPPPANGMNPADSLPKYDPAVVYILEFCTNLATKNSEAIEHLAKQVFDALQGILRDATRWHAIVVSRATIYALALLKSSYDHNFANVPYLLHSISSLPQDMLIRGSGLVLEGLAYCIAEPGSLRNEMMTSPDFWATLQVLTRNVDSAARVFTILEMGTTGTPSAIMADNYEVAVSLLNDFASAAGAPALPEAKADPTQRRVEQQKTEIKRNKDAIERGCKAVHMLQNMTLRIPQLMQQSHLESSEAWSAYWLPIFQALTTQCTNPCREVRQLAFSALQRSLLSPELTCSDPKEWTAIFGKVLFPLILRLLKPEVFSSDRDGMSEMRVQSASLLCKVFLQYLVLLSEWDGMLDLWIKIVDIMDRLMNSGQGDSLVSGKHIVWLMGLGFHY